MSVEIHGRVLWELFVAIHPVLKQALPKNVDRGSLSSQNDITKIRHNIRAIPLLLPNAEVDQTKFDGSEFSKPLRSLLKVLETLVSDEIGKDYVFPEPDLAGSEEQSDVRTVFTVIYTFH
jgi:hypothetical protein